MALQRYAAGTASQADQHVIRGSFVHNGASAPTNIAGDGFAVGAPTAGVFPIYLADDVSSLVAARVWTDLANVRQVVRCCVVAGSFSANNYAAKGVAGLSIACDTVTLIPFSGSYVTKGSSAPDVVTGDITCAAPSTGVQVVTIGPAADAGATLRECTVTLHQATGGDDAVFATIGTFDAASAPVVTVETQTAAGTKGDLTGPIVTVSGTLQAALPSGMRVYLELVVR